MESSNLQPLLEANIGKTVAVTYNGITEPVIVVSVDDDGFLCRPQASAHEEMSEFWLSYLDTAGLEPVWRCT
jgi:hypothetical protein